MFLVTIDEARTILKEINVYDKKYRIFLDALTYIEMLGKVKATFDLEAIDYLIYNITK